MHAMWPLFLQDHEPLSQYHSSSPDIGSPQETLKQPPWPQKLLRDSLNHPSPFLGLLDPASGVA